MPASSAVAFAPVPYTANYAAAKAYIASLGQALHYELHGAGVDVLTLAPGPVRTEGADNAEGIDFGKLPVPGDEAGPVVRAVLRALGRKPLIIPGFLNKASDFAGKYLTPRRVQAAMFGRSAAAPSTKSRTAADETASGRKGEPFPRSG